MYMRNIDKMSHTIEDVHDSELIDTVRLLGRVAAVISACVAFKLLGIPLLLIPVTHKTGHYEQ